MRYHRAANLIDYVFRTLQVKLLYEAKHLPQPIRMRTDHLNNGGNHPFKHEEAITSKAYNPDGYFDTGYHINLFLFSIRVS